MWPAVDCALMGGVSGLCRWGPQSRCPSLRVLGCKVVYGDAPSVQNAQSALMHAEVWCMGNALNKNVCQCTTEKAQESMGKCDMQHLGQGQGWVQQNMQLCNEWCAAWIRWCAQHEYTDRIWPIPYVSFPFLSFPFILFLLFSTLLIFSCYFWWTLCHMAQILIY